MKALTHLCLSFWLLGGTMTIAQHSAMTYNIRYDNPDDGENWWKYRKDDVIKLLKFYEPNILGIQEGLHEQVEYLNKKLTTYKYVGVGRDDGKIKGEYTAIFYDTGIFDLMETQTYWLSETPEKVSIGWDAALERITTYVALKRKGSNQTIHVFNCHYDHMGEMARTKSSELLLKLIEEKGLNNEHLIVMGDFNATPNELAITTLESRLNDANKFSVKPAYGPIGTFNGFKTNAQLEKRIDYIFIKKLNVLSYKTIDDRRANQLFPSDHLPVLITWR